jgi:hypothetical protein
MDWCCDTGDNALECEDVNGECNSSCCCDDKGTFKPYVRLELIDASAALSTGRSSIAFRERLRLALARCGAATAKGANDADGFVAKGCDVGAKGAVPNVVDEAAASLISASIMA